MMKDVLAAMAMNEKHAGACALDPNGRPDVASGFNGKTDSS